MSAALRRQPLHSLALRDNPHHGLFRSGQFMLGRRFPPGVDAWRRLVLGQGLKLAVHPTLGVAQVSGAQKSLTAIGYLIDPREPTATDDEILAGLLHSFGSLEDLFLATSRLGGRWLLIATHGRKSYLFGDALGLRQAFYTSPGVADGLYVMSEAAAGAALLGLPVDGEARAYMDSELFRTDPEYTWPVASSPFRGIERLLPNHYLDLQTGVCKRFWPSERLHTVAFEEGVTQVAGLLKGLLAAAANRFELVVNVTSGIDSRVVLAASREIRHRVSFATIRQSRMPDGSPDIAVPSALLSRLGLEHEVIHSPVSATPEFARVFMSSSYLAHAYYAADAESIWRRYKRTKVAVTGSGGEVARCPHREELPWFDRKRACAAYLSRIQSGTRDTFAMRHLQRWLDDVGSGHGINKLDLFEWEHECGSWLATTQLEFDIAWKDIFTPFNCRELLVTMLSVPTRYRKGPDFPLFQRVIQQLWPEVQDAPINPHRRHSAVQRYIVAAEMLVRHAFHHFRYR